ncbi:MAG: DUF4157 domain-containing protein [Proteobacteria bacterium]|nr:DUF4157 domain-containing protein [Pseudomonadota bacterium]
MTDRAPSGKTRTDPEARRAPTRQGAAHSSPAAPPGASVLQSLQQAAGNAAIGSLLASGGGRPLPPALRRDMERRFGHDFHAVRIHDGPRGAEAADAVAAKAMTHGRHIVFAQGRFAPDTTDGKRLLAHELAHVVQQGRGGDARPTLDGNGPLEASASQAADSAVSGSGPVAVTGGSAAGPAAEPEEKSWWQRQQERLSTAATVAKEAYDDPGAALAKVEAKGSAVYNEYAEKARETVADAKEAWDNSDVKKFAVEQVEQKTLDEQLAEMAEKNLPAESDDSPSAQLQRSAVQLMKASAKLNAEPKRAALRAMLDGHPIQAVQDWQNATDAGLKDMKTATFTAIDKWEDGKFDTPVQNFIDPAEHPTLATVEHGLNTAGQEFNKRQRQVTGGASKALYSMVEGLGNIVVHPVNTAEGLGKIAEMGSPLPSRDTLAQGANFARDLFDPSVSTGDAFKRLYQAEQDKQAARSKTTVELLKGIGHNYVEAAGGEFVPPEAEQTLEQKERFAGKKPGEIDWGDWSKRERIGEIPGLLLVDVGSFFIGGGEANAVTKTARVASATGRVGELGETANVLGKLGEGSGTVGKFVEGASDIGKMVEGTGDIGKVVDGGGDVGKTVEGAGDVGRTAEGTGDVGKAADAKSVGPDMPAAQPAAVDKPLDAPRDIKSAKGPRYDPRVKKALDEAPKGAEAKPLQKGAEPPPDNLYDINSKKKIPADDRLPPDEARAEAVPEELPEQVAEPIKEAAGAEGQAPVREAPRASTSNPFEPPRGKPPPGKPTLVQPQGTPGPGAASRGGPGRGTGAPPPGKPPPVPEKPPAVVPETGAQFEARELAEGRAAREAAGSEAYFAYEGGNSGSIRGFLKQVEQHFRDLRKGGSSAKAPAVDRSILSQTREQFIRDNPALSGPWQQEVGGLHQQLADVFREYSAAKGDPVLRRQLLNRQRALEKQIEGMDKWAQGQIGSLRPDLVEIHPQASTIDITDITQRPFDPSHNFKTELYQEIFKSLYGWNDVRGLEYGGPMRQRPL